MRLMTWGQFKRQIYYRMAFVFSVFVARFFLERGNNPYLMLMSSLLWGCLLTFWFHFYLGLRQMEKRLRIEGWFDKGSVFLIGMPK